MAKISVLINNFNTKDLLKDCVENLVKLTLDLEVIIADSGSTDGSSQMIKDVFGNNPKVILVERPNTGISNGYNLALAKSSGDFLLYLGTDAFPTKETLEGLVAYFNDPQNFQVGMATTKLVTRTGELDMDAHRGTLTPWVGITHFTFLDRLFKKSKLFNQYSLGFMNMDEPHEIGACISHFMFVRRSAQDKVGKWDEDFFVFGEDIDFCYRMKSAGFKIMYLPQWSTLHYKGAGIGRKNTNDLKNASRGSEITKKILSTERTKAMKLYFHKHIANDYPKFLTWMVFFAIFCLEKIRWLIVTFTFKKTTKS